MIRSRWFRVEYLIFLLAIAVRIIPGPRIIDDAYITFRYSQNFLSGNGLVYNPGEAVLGTTTPLYALLISLIALFFRGSLAPYPQLALGINAFADGFTCLLLMKLARRLGFPKAGTIGALLWALSPMSVTFAIGGMETSFTILLLMGSLYMYSIHRPVATALLAYIPCRSTSVRCSTFDLGAYRIPVLRIPHPTIRERENGCLQPAK